MKRASVYALLLCLLGGWSAAAEVVIVGGEGGLDWVSGGGEIQATVIRSATSVENTNAPGGVIDFNAEGFRNWIFPQRADTTLNIAVGANSEARGGSITSPNTINIRPELPSIIDNDGETALDLRASAGGQSARVLGIIIDLDLGARFGINRFKFFPRNADPAFPAPAFPYQNDFMRAFEIFINDGTPETQREGVPIRETVVLVNQNEDPVVDVRIPPQYVRFVRLKSLTATGFDLAEFQVFGTGFVPEATYISNVFDFGDLSLFGTLRWVEQKAGDSGLSRVLIRTRTGNDPQPVEYNKIRPGEQIFRLGGGSRQTGTTARGDEVPWKFAADVEDAELKTLVETVLDNEDVDLREALQIFKDLSLEQQEQISLTATDFGRLRNEDKGNIRNDVTNWSAWSPPYPVSALVESDADLADALQGVPVVSPSPRRYFQFAIEFSSDEFESATGVGGISFEVLPSPFAEELIAEIVPRQAALGEKTDFTLAVLSKLRPGLDRGFNRLQIDTPLKVENVGLIEVRRSDGTTTEVDFSGAALDQLPFQRGDFAVVEATDNSFIFEFPIVAEDGTEVRVTFDNAVLRFGTTFTTRAFNSGEEVQIAQDVVSGNAADLGEADPDLQPLGTPFSGNLSVAVPIVGDLLVNVSAAPGAFSPNGDGINDQAAVQYDITNIARPTDVEIVVRDLAGRPVRNLYRGLDSSGRHARLWDGKNDAGEALPPGNYLFSVTLDAGTGQERGVGMVSLAY